MDDALLQKLTQLDREQLAAKLAELQEQRTYVVSLLRTATVRNRRAGRTGRVRKAVKSG
jgi:hypothetical protein